MAPEMYEEGEYTDKVDVFSFGLILYEVVVGEPVFPPNLVLAKVMAKVLAGKRKPIPDFVLDWVRDIISKCWDMNPDLRPSFLEIECILRGHDFGIVGEVDNKRVKSIISTFTCI
jgi:serine/threonine protein kinase